MTRSTLPDSIAPGAIISWVQFGDLHITSAAERNYQDFLALIHEVNEYFRSAIAFAVLPGDNADDGTEDQYRLVRAALESLAVPVYAIPGDHDRKTGTLALFRKHLAAEPLQAFTLAEYRFVFCNSLDSDPLHSSPGREFDFGPAQMAWLETELSSARADGLAPVLFMHTYPSELAEAAQAVRDLIATHKVLFVAMGHTHYNELANDGRTIYAATRSTGQIEEGPAGVSITNLDKGVVSWKFKPLGERPFVMITSPADHRLIVNSASAVQVVRGSIPVRARVWGAGANASVVVQAGDGEPVAMIPGEQPGVWTCDWDSGQWSDGEHHLSVHVIQDDGTSAEDLITVLVNRNGDYTPPEFRPRDLDNSIGRYVSKGILGTQLGPNKNGKKW
jgi:predicted phosphodiesterase